MKATATQVKTRFGEYLDKARREHVEIERSGRVVAVMVPIEDYEQWRAIEDRIWAERATEAAKSGYLGPEKSMSLLVGRLQEIEQSGEADED